MSFSSDVKDELLKLIPEKPHCVRAELFGITRGSGAQNRYPSYLEPFVKLLRKTENAEEADEAEILQRPCCKRTYLRGLFLSSGFLSDPEKDYHLEIVLKTQREAYDLKELMRCFDLAGKIVERKGHQVVYLKEGDQIVQFLGIIGATKSLLSLENIRVVKDVRNDVNRKMNFEVANLKKTALAAMDQIEAIEKIRDLIGLEKLPDTLRETAVLRLENPESSLEELGLLMDPPVGKSGVNHRIRRLKAIAEEEKI